MKKYVSLFLVLTCILGLIGCEQIEDIRQGDNKMQYFFSAKVLEVHEEYLLLEVFDIGNSNLSDGAKIEVSTEVVAATGCSAFVAGEYARVLMAWNTGDNSSGRLEALAIYKIDETGMNIAEYTEETETVHMQGLMVDGVFYEIFYEPMPGEVDESAIIGYVQSYTNTFPDENGETNISRELIDAPYAKVQGGIAVLYQSEWHLCTPETMD